MNAAYKIQEQILASPTGQPFSASSFRHVASYENARQTLGRLVKAGAIKRVTRGIYVKPKQVPYIGESLPSPIEIVQAIAQTTGEVIAIHGAEAARRLQLTTQVPMQPVFYTTGNTREIKTGNRTIFLQRISPRKLVAPGTMAGTVISALWFLGKSNTTQEIVAKIKQQLSAEEFQQVLNHIDHMPAWMASLFYQYQ